MCIYRGTCVLDDEKIHGRSRIKGKFIAAKTSRLFAFVYTIIKTEFVAMSLSIIPL